MESPVDERVVCSLCYTRTSDDDEGKMQCGVTRGLTERGSASREEPASEVVTRLMRASVISVVLNEQDAFKLLLPLQ